ncbi:hypothetical protein [Pedobacter sp. L105]|uniref:hypothetical protein n=1 Tax=Pedobacter sp. L105 TaxID=1641871 RepID=UPI00131D03D9|nr:hypothetical protein [Pedobacter sp. L105]
MDPRNISSEVLIAFAIIVAILCCFLFMTFIFRKILNDSVQKDIDEVLEKKETDVLSNDQ